MNRHDRGRLGVAPPHRIRGPRGRWNRPAGPTVRKTGCAMAMKAKYTMGPAPTGPALFRVLPRLGWG